MLRRKRSVSFGGFGWIDKSSLSALKARTALSPVPDFIRIYPQPLPGARGKASSAWVFRLHLCPGLADWVEVLCGRLCEGQVSVMEEETGIEGRRVGSKRKGGLEEVRL
ncbi:unnamed protein product [Boreogadus saida]